jgi:WhiB family transcriptional regulator, redox-sensing transcriptional regulator
MFEHPVVHETWRQRAACSGMDTSVFYPGERERGPTLARREKRAKQICAQCPVISNCLKWALDAREPFGVWGGTSAKERARMLEGRDRRGGPRGSTTRLGETGQDRGEAQHVVRAGEIGQRDEHRADSPLGQQPVPAEMVGRRPRMVAAGEGGRRRSAS